LKVTPTRRHFEFQKKIGKVHCATGILNIL